MNELTNLEQKTLKSAILHFAEEPFATEALEKAFIGRLTGFAAELALERLRERGIIVTRRKAWGESVHMIAPGLFDDWQRWAVPSLSEALLEGDADEFPREPKAELAKLILFFAAEAANRGLKLTQKGMFRKTDAIRLAEQLKVDAAELQGWPIAYLHEHLLEKPLAVVFDAALRLGLVRTGADAVETDEEKLNAWVSQPLCDIRRQVLSLWWEVYTPPDPWLQHTAAAMRNLPRGRWFSVPRLADVLLSSGANACGRSAEEAQEALVNYWIRPMSAFGLAEMAQTPEGTAARLMEEAAGEEEGWFVQPDFECIVPPGVPYRARWELERFAERIGGEVVDRYRFTRESWERALKAGKEGEALIEIIRAHAVTGIPRQVEETLREWSSSYGAILLQDAALLICRNAEDAAHVAADPELAGKIAAKIGEFAFIVKDEEKEALFASLKRQGFSVAQKTSARKSGDGNARSGGKSGGKALPSLSGIIRSRAGAPPYPIDPSPQGAAALRERIANVPAAWRQTFRRYHSSTIREMLETAIAVKTAVRLTVDGREVELVPKRLAASGSSWLVEGYIDGKETIVPAASLGKAQLIVPELA